MDLLTIEIWKIVIRYIDLMLLGPKIYFDLTNFSLYKCYIPVSLLWKRMDVWLDQLTTSNKYTISLFITKFTVIVINEQIVSVTEPVLKQYQI